MPRTATTGNALLGLLALRPAWSTYELSQQLRRNMRFFWPRAESRIYAEAKALVEGGLARSDEVRQGRRTRTVYRITPAGRRQLSAWLATPPRGTALECEPVLRVFLGDLAEDSQIQAAIDQVRADANAILEVGRRVSQEYLAGAAPFQDQVHLRAIVFDFLSHHAMMLNSWADRTERTLAKWPGQSEEQRIADALRAIGSIRGRYPEAP